MQKSCQRCGSDAYPEDKYCGICGFELAAQVAPSASEGTQVDLKLSDIRYNLGMIYYKKGEFNKAAETFENLLKEDPENPQFQEMLDMAKGALKEG